MQTIVNFRLFARTCKITKCRETPYFERISHVGVSLIFRLTATAAPKPARQHRHKKGGRIRTTGLETRQTDSRLVLSAIKAPKSHDSGAFLYLCLKTICPYSGNPIWPEPRCVLLYQIARDALKRPFCSARKSVDLRRAGALPDLQCACFMPCKMPLETVQRISISNEYIVLM